MLAFIMFLAGLLVGVIVFSLVYYNNAEKTINELESLRGERDALKRKIEELTKMLRKSK